MGVLQVRSAEIRWEWGGEGGGVREGGGKNEITTFCTTLSSQVNGVETTTLIEHFVVVVALLKRETLIDVTSSEKYA